VVENQEEDPVSTARRISRDPHLGAADKKRNVGRVGIAVADETRGILGCIHCRLEYKTIRGRITQGIDGFDMDAAASFATR
jgi:hypothetical protein